MRPIKVFIVDDDRDLAESLGILLRLEGVETELAFSAEEAIGRVRDTDFDLALVDFKLPGMTGSDCLRAFRKIKPGARVVMMTAYGAKGLFDQLAKDGALALLDKPLDVEEVMAMVTALEPNEPKEERE